MLKYVTAALVGATLLIGGCNSPTGETGVVVEQEPVVFVPSYVFTSQKRTSLPYPNDVWFGGSTDGTLNIPGLLSSTGAAGANLPSVNTLDGYSINAPISVPFSSPVDLTSIKPYMPVDLAGTPLYGAETNFWVLNTKTGLPVIPLIQPIPGVFPGTTPCIVNETGPIPCAQYEVRVSAATDSGGKMLEIVPLGPLDPDTTYAFVITAGVTDLDGNALGPDNEFRTVRDACFSGETLSNGILEALRSSPAVCPLLDTVTQLFPLPVQAIMVAWTVSTQSISNTMDVISESTVAGVSALQFTGQNTSDLPYGLPPIADIFVGFIELPYYLDPTDPYGRGMQGAGGSTLSRYNPIPVVTTTLRAPLLMTVPNALSGQVKPAEGWPVVIFLHGITSNRTNMLLMAASYASQGFAVIAIDMAFHGITDPTNPFFVAPGGPTGVLERHFYIDAFDASTGAQAPDGIIDDGGQLFAVSLQKPIISRDAFAQSAADLVQLARDIPVMDFEGATDPGTGAPVPDGTPDFDGSRIHYVGHSFGAIVGGPFLGIQNEIATATIANGGGTLTILLTDPEAKVYGRNLVRGLAALAGLQQGTLPFDDFVRDWQNVLERMDPISYAKRAAEHSPILLTEVIGDQHVANAGTDYLAQVMGASTLTNGLIEDPTGIRGITRFTSGGHSTLLNPYDQILDYDDGSVVSAQNPLATTEMQTQAVMNAASNGVQIAVGSSGCNCIQ